MRKIFILSLACMLGITSYAQNRKNVVILPDMTQQQKMRAGYPVFPDSIVFSSDAEEITIPDLGTWFINLKDYHLPNLKKIKFGNIDYINSFSFENMPKLEEIEFEGLVGICSGRLIKSCPNLRKVTFKGPVSCTGGATFAIDCPKLKTVKFESVVSLFYSSISAEDNCPKLKRFINNGAFLHVNNKEAAAEATIDQLTSNPKLIADIEKLADWYTEVLNTPNAMGLASTFRAASVLHEKLEQLGNPKAEKLKTALNQHYDYNKNKLEVLKSSPAYATDDTHPNLTFKYAEPSDSMLTTTRIKYNLDSIAGYGDDISKIKNILFWVHDNIRHNGNGKWPKGPLTLSNTMESFKKDGKGYNCRVLAICLAEALLSVGIPSRYITCLPRAWQFDSECHVINVAWSKSLNKWIWVDPSFAAYVTDDTGLLLHPGEVRYRLQHDLPLVLNKDANWNNEDKQTKEYYLEEYMAKNLYFIESNTFNQAEPEGNAKRETGKRVVLVPEGEKSVHDYVPTSNEKWFWQAP